MKSKKLYRALENIKSASGELHVRQDFFELGRALSEINPDDLEYLLFGIYERQHQISDPAEISDPFMIINPFFKRGE